MIDTATVPLAFGNSQPATEMVVTALIGTPYDTELDLEKLFAIAKYFEGVRLARAATTAASRRSPICRSTRTRSRAA